MWPARWGRRPCGRCVVGPGVTDWDSLVTRLAATTSPGLTTSAARSRASPPWAALLADLVSGRSPTQPVLESPGWWRRQGRLWVIPHPDPYPHGFPPTSTAMRDRARVGHRAILIAGGKGTLATAFARICASRGLAV